MNKELRISNILKDLGISAHLAGYHYLRKAIGYLIEDMSLMNRIVTVVYKKVAKDFDTTPARVERAIRHAIGSGWLKANLETANKLFGYTLSTEQENPTNSEFIVTVADYYNMVYGEEQCQSII